MNLVGTGAVPYRRGDEHYVWGTSAVGKIQYYTIVIYTIGKTIICLKIIINTITLSEPKGQNNSFPSHRLDVVMCVCVCVCLHLPDRSACCLLYYLLYYILYNLLRAILYYVFSCFFSSWARGVWVLGQCRRKVRPKVWLRQRTAGGQERDPGQDPGATFQQGRKALASGPRHPWQKSRKGSSQRRRKRRPRRLRHIRRPSQRVWRWSEVELRGGTYEHRLSQGRCRPRAS